MARGDSRVMTLFGAGWQARAQLDAIARVLPALQRVNVVSRSPERVAAFCADMRPVLESIGSAAAGALVAAGDIAAAVRESDLITTITGSKVPLFDGAWLQPGTHVNAAGSNFAEKRELDSTAVARAVRIVADDVEVAKIESGDLVNAAGLDWSRVRPLADVVGGGYPGRGSADEITLFESQGLGLEDLAVAAVLLERAAERGIGIDIPLQ
jgi:ornithine cyclodeaminase/alanine dehydrogenase-like protein (mu-crystallin family)